MGLLPRLFFFAAGLFFAFVAKMQAGAGRFVFDNASYRQTTFAWAGYAVGAFFCLLAFLPPKEWVYRLITTRRSRRRPHQPKPH